MTPRRLPGLLVLVGAGVAWPGSAASAQEAATGPSDPNAAVVAGRSLLLPGWGQRTLGQRRAWGYALVEAALWGLWAERRSAGGDLRDRYRDLAWTEGRLRTGDRVDGDFAYYETLSKWTRSGAFDGDPLASGVQPEEDPATFNGSIWALARDLYLGEGGPASPDDPGYARALDYYMARAYGEALLWDWTGKVDTLEEYRALIHRSDDRYRQATAAIGAVLANHLLSATDAYLSARSRHDVGVRVAPPSPEGRGWTLLVRVRPGR